MHRRLSWTELTRFGIPDFILARPLTITGGLRSEAGTLVTLADLSEPKLRGLYERRRIEPHISDETGSAPLPAPPETKSTATSKTGRKKKD